MTPADARRIMRLAVREAYHGDPSPNPRVGAVIVRDGHIVAKGFHARAGAAHAEVDAIRNAGGSVAGATLFVTFEPCNHHGRTGPCTEAILAAGISRVVIGCRDPHPHVPGAIERLRAAGVDVELGVLEQECEALVRDFVKHLCERVPFVVAKAAVTLDGRMATASGSSKWITGERARRHGQRMRAQSDAVLVGIGTVLADDPLLTVRDVVGRSPMRVVIDTRLRIPVESQLVRTARDVQTLVLHGPGAAPARLEELHALGVRTSELPLSCGHADLEAVLVDLGRRDVVRLLVEGGPSIHRAMLARGLVDRIALFVAPKWAGGEASMTFDPGANALTMDEALVLDRTKVRRFGQDVLVEGDVPKTRRRPTCSPA